MVSLGCRAGISASRGTASFGLYGVVSACDSGSALPKAIVFATRHWPEIAQGIQTSHGEATVHAGEINEVVLVPGVEFDVVDVSWC